MALNAKHEIFCQEYLKDLNGTQAAIRAGYSAKTAHVQASKLLSNPNISARVKELKAKRAEELELDAYWVLKRLKDISDRAMQAEPVMVWDHSSGEMVETGEYTFDSNGANKATELIGKHIGMFDQKAQFVGQMTELQMDKIKSETELIRERTNLIKGAKKDTSLLDVLIQTVKKDG